MEKMSRNTAIFIYLLLTIATLTVFYPVQNHDFVNFDDQLYILDNPNVQAGLSLKSIYWALTSAHLCNWHPLTWVSHMLDYDLYGLNPKGHHLNNLLFHIANSLLLLAFLNRMTGALWRSVFVAALFALHPLHVEPVAWVSSRKDVLSTLFWLLTMWFYAYYTELPNLKRYFLVLLFFIFGLMSKPMLVTLPFVFLLLDYWPFRRFAFKVSQYANKVALPKLISGSSNLSLPVLILEKAPFLVLSIGSSIITYLSQQSCGAVKSLETISLKLRIINALVSYTIYFGKTIWPHDLIFFYPYPKIHSQWFYIGAGFFLATLFLSVIYLAQRHPYLTVGWLWYVGTLVPVIGLVQVGSQAMADRYTYIPLIGLFIMIAWGIPRLFKNWHYQRMFLFISGGTLILFLIICSSMQVRHWKNTKALFEHAIDVTERNYSLYKGLSIYLTKQGKHKEAVSVLYRALDIEPSFILAHNDLAVVLARQGDIESALSHLFEALKIKPDYAEAHYNLGVIMDRQGKHNDAAVHYSEALRIDPKYKQARANLKVLLQKLGR